MNIYIIVFIQAAEQILSMLVIVHVILSFFISPYHLIRQTVDRLVEPLLAPIRQILPQTGVFDFSPLVLLILIQLIAGILISILR